MQAPKTYRLTVHSSVFDPDTPSSREIQFKEVAKEKALYRVFLYLTGEDLPYVEKVIYILHPTFPQRTLDVYRRASNPTCKATIWTWGTFELLARIEMKNGASVEIQHPLEWDKDLERPDANFTPIPA